MYRAALRSSPSALRAVRPTVSSGSRRLLSTASPKKGTWKGTGLRWGLAAGAVYFYNTSPIFADEVPPLAGPAPSPFSDADLPTVDALIEKKRREGAAAAPPPTPAPKAAAAPVTPQEKKEIAPPAEPTDELAGSAEALEQEAAQEGAFNPETGEINWDCPCLGGMAHGPCGENFRAAFSCFVFSTEEPKGMDCIEKFQGMQDCFREYPEIYAAEIADDEEPTFDSAPSDEPLSKGEAPKTELGEAVAQTIVPVAEAVKEKAMELKDEVKAQSEVTPKSEVKPKSELKPKSEAKPASEAIPDKAHDATAANRGKE